MLSVAGLTQFEKDRLRRIAENKKRLDALLVGVDTSLIRQQPTKPNRAKAPPKKRQKVVPSEADIRRSSRISSKPAPLYFIEEDATHSRGRSRRMSMGGRAPHGERCHGLQLTAAGGSGADDLYLAAPKGWKPELGCASIEAAEAATNAALATQAELAAAGRSSFVKLMSASQVSSGFWMQLPLDIVQFYKGSQRVISLHCLDKQHQPPDSFQYANRGSSSSWPVVYLPKGGEDSAGLSGGWRGFAIDQRLHPNDTLLFEVVDEPPPPGSSCRQGGSGGSGSGGTAADDAGEQAADAGGGGGGPPAAAPVAPSKRAHLLAHIFRAFSYEERSQQQQAASSADSQQAEGDGSQAAPGSEESGGSEEGEEEEDGGEGDDAAGGKDQDEQQKQGRQQRRLAVAQQQAALRPKQEQEQQQAGGRSEAELLQAAAAGQLRGLKIATLQQRTTAASCAPAARDTASGGGRGGSTKKRQRQPAATPLPPAAAAAAAADQRPSGGRRASGRVRRAKRFHDGSEAGGPDAGGSAAAGGGGGGGAGALMPKPACPAELVAPPSEAEVARDAAGGPFYVKQILAHRVSASGGDEFLVSWTGFGSWWDSWEPEGSLDAPPGSYSWRGGRSAVPAKFRDP